MGNKFKEQAKPEEPKKVEKPIKDMKFHKKQDKKLDKQI